MAKLIEELATAIAERSNVDQDCARAFLGAFLKARRATIIDAASPVSPDAAKDEAEVPAAE